MFSSSKNKKEIIKKGNGTIADNYTEKKEPTTPD
jgi:hypothetical protein